MKALSLKLKEELFQEIEQIVHQIHTPRNAYINEALAFYNQIQRRRLLRNKLRVESKLVRSSSLDVLREFEKIEDGLD